MYQLYQQAAPDALLCRFANMRCTSSHRRQGSRTQGSSKVGQSNLSCSQAKRSGYFTFPVCFHYSLILLFSLTSLTPSLSFLFQAKDELGKKQSASINTLSLISGVVVISGTGEEDVRGDGQVEDKARLAFQAFDFMQGGAITATECTILFLRYQT